MQGLAIVGKISFKDSNKVNKDSKMDSVGFQLNSKKVIPLSASVNFVKLFGPEGKIAVSYLLEAKLIARESWKFR